MPGRDRALEEADKAAAEAAAIGGHPSSEPAPADGPEDEAKRPLVEAGQGESEGFEQAEEELIARASHEDQHAARRAIDDASRSSDELTQEVDGEADHERSSERTEDLPGR
jgi:hypothetical protein